jgi:polyhydroxyalkanoate synthase
MVVNNVPLDLSKIDVPCYFLSTVGDHIVPWQGSYLGTELVSGPSRFVLAGSGHLAGVINPVEGGKYPHWVNDQLAPTAEQWLEGAAKKDGSWWPDWNAWMAPISGKKITSPKPGKCATHPAIEDAPGRYVKVRI